MGIWAKIRDGATKLSASILKPSGEKTGFNVLTRPAKIYENVIKFFVNEANGVDMAVDADTLTVTEWIHDGIDNVYWTASAISGTWTFNDATYNHTPAGAQSVSAVATVSGDTAQFLRGGGLLALTSPISAIGVWVYITAWGGGEKSILFRGWDTTAGSQVGNDIDLSDYIDTGVLGVWQHAIVPLGDMGLNGQSIDSVRVQTQTILGVYPNYYLDDMQILQGDPPLQYIVKPNAGTWLYVTEINITVVDAYDSILTVAGATENSTMPKIPYNGFLGESAFANGIIYQQINNNEIQDTITIKQLFDIIRLPGAEVVGLGSDGTNSWIKIRFKIVEPLLLKHENNDKLIISLSDDLSGLLELQMSTGGREEVRSGDLYEP